MTERELAEIEARIEAELATGGWSDEPDITFDLLRDEVPRLLEEVRRLQAQIHAYRDGIAGLDARVADGILDRALQAGRDRRRRERLPLGEVAGQEPVLEALEPERHDRQQRRGK